MFDFIDKLPITGQIELLKIIEDKIFTNISMSLKDIKIKKYKNDICFILQVENFKVVIKHVNDSLKLGLISSEVCNYSDSIFKKIPLININDNISLKYYCEYCDKEEDSDIDIYFKNNECSYCKFIFFDVCLKKYEQNIKDIIDLKSIDNNIKIFNMFSQDIKHFFALKNIKRFIKL
jgi:hypothetical protein